MDALGSLAQLRGLPYRGCFGSGRGRAQWRRLCDWGNGSRNIVVCEPAMYPFRQLQRPLYCGIGHIHYRWGIGHSTEVLKGDYLVGGDHPLFTARDHPLLVPRWCHCLGHSLEVVLWQDSCMVWSCEEGGPARTYCLVSQFCSHQREYTLLFFSRHCAQS